MWGYSAHDSQLVETREFDMAAAAIAYGLPAGMFSSKWGKAMRRFMLIVFVS